MRSGRLYTALATEITLAKRLPAREFAVPAIVVFTAVSISLIRDETARWSAIGLLCFVTAVCAVWQRLPRWLYLFFSVDLLSPPVSTGDGGFAFHYSVVIAGIGLCVGALQWQEWVPVEGSLPRACGLFVLALIASLPFAVFYSGAEIAAGSAARLALFLIGPCALIYALCGPGMRPDEPLRLGKFLFAFACLAATFACLDYYFHFPAPVAFGDQYVWLREGVFRRAQGLFYEASTLGNFCAFFLIYGLISLIEKRGGWPTRLYVAAGVTVLAAAIILSYSRASVLNVAIAMAVYGALRVKRIRGLSGVMVCALGVAAFAIHSLLPSFAANYWLRIETTFTFWRERPDLVLSGRLSNWHLLTTFITSHPWQTFFGIGYKTLPYTSYLGDPVIADNSYLSLLVETGIAGVITFLLLLTRILKTSYKAARSQSPQAAFLGAWAFCFWCGQTVQMFSGDLLTYWRVLPLYFWLAGAALRATEEAE